LRARHSDETLREADRNCLLLRAAAQGQLPRVQHLLRLGADVDFADDSGFTALHHAVSSGFEDCVQELIGKGADINALASCGVALNIAADKRRNHVADILLRARADCDEAIAFAMETGLDLGVLRESLTQAVQRLVSVEHPTTDGVAGDIYLKTWTDRRAKAGDGHVIESVDVPPSTTPGNRNEDTNSEIQASSEDNVTRTSGGSPEQVSLLKGFFRMLTGHRAEEA
jgi:ankyrin repeat protein